MTVTIDGRNSASVLGMTDLALKRAARKMLYVEDNPINALIVRSIL